MYQQNPLLEMSTNTVAHLTSALAVGNGGVHIGRANKTLNQLNQISNDINNCKTVKELKQVTDTYHLDVGDLWYYVKRYKMPFYEVQQQIIDIINSNAEKAKLERKIGYVTAGVGGVGALLTGPKFYKSVKTGLKNLKR